MVINICPRCNRRYITESDACDFVHTCDADVPAIDQEDVVVVGNWSDYTGSADATNVLLQGAENKLWGTRAQIEGEDLDPITDRGVSASTHRSRQHLEFIKLKDCDTTC